MLEFATNSSSIGETFGLEVEQWQEAQEGQDFMTVLPLPPTFFAQDF